MAEGISDDDDCWTRVYPEKGLLNCPRCYSSFWRVQQRERHMSESHNLTRQQWQCSVCTNRFPTKRHVATHFVRAHPSSSSTITSDDDEEEDNNPHQCSYCDRSLPSKQDSVTTKGSSIKPQCLRLYHSQL